MITKRLLNGVFYMRIKGQPDEINKVFKEVNEMISDKNNIKRNLDEIFVFSVSDWFINDLAEYLYSKYKLITISYLKA